MYAIVFDIEIQCLKDNYHNESFNNAYGNIRAFMEQNDFIWQQGSVYFGKENITAVSCVLIIQRLAKQYDWFRTCVKDVRMLRIEENNDLMPAIRI
jgi:virulence-associated protein VapD